MSFKRLLLLVAVLVGAAACGGSNADDLLADPTPATPTPRAATPLPRPSRTLTLAPTPSPSVRTGSFAFAAGGDHGANANTAASFAVLDQSGADFYLALGDLDYDQAATDEAWCAYVHERLPTLGPEFPFELVSGNHEEQGGPNGYILNHAACLPDRLNSTGDYGAQYYFDYPAELPLARVIMIAPNLNVDGTDYEYTAGSEPSRWLTEAIESARGADIPWVVVGMHKNCMTTGAKGCEIGEDLLNLLVEEKVDVVLQGHDHNYQRSKQLALGPSCDVLEEDSFNSGCVAGGGANGSYTRGEGTVVVISGAFGMSLYPVKPGDPEADYFAVIDANSHGFTKFSVTGDRIEAEFVPSTGDFTDGFTIASD